MGFYKAFSSSSTTIIGRLVKSTRFKGLIKTISRFQNLSDATVLEVGPGRGDFAKHFRDAGSKVILYEPSTYLEEQLRMEGFSHIKNDFVPPLLEPDNSLDIVVLMYVLEHMKSRDKAVELLSEIKRCLKPGGMLLLVGPDAFFFGMHYFNVDYTHDFPTTRYRLEQMFIDLEMEVLVKRLYSGPFYGFWTPILGELMKALFFFDWVSDFRIRKKLNKIRYSFMVNNMFLVRKP